MALTFDAVGPSSAGTLSATSPLTWPHTCTGSQGVLLVAISVDSTNDAGVTTAATYNSVAMTSVLRWHSGGSGQTVGFLEVFKLVNPSTGANTVSVTVTGTFNEITGGSLSFAGADQSTGIGAVTHSDSGGVTATAASITVTPTTSGNIVAAFVCDGSDTLAVTAGTSRYIVTGSSSVNAAGWSAGATSASTGSGVTVSWSQAADFYACIAFEVLAAAAGTGTPTVPYAFAGMRTEVIPRSDSRVVRA